MLGKLAAKAHPSLLPNQREVLIVDQFISGLNSSEIRRHVSFAHPENLDEAINLAVKFESFEGDQSIKKPSGTTVNVVTGVTEENLGTSDSKLQATILGELVKASKENAKAIGTLNQVIQNLSKNQSKSGNREQGKYPNFRLYRQDKPRGLAIFVLRRIIMPVFVREIPKMLVGRLWNRQMVLVIIWSRTGWAHGRQFSQNN